MVLHAPIGPYSGVTGVPRSWHCLVTLGMCHYSWSFMICILMTHLGPLSDKCGMQCLFWGETAAVAHASPRIHEESPKFLMDLKGELCSIEQSGMGPDRFQSQSNRCVSLSDVWMSAKAEFTPEPQVIEVNWWLANASWSFIRSLSLTGASRRETWRWVWAESTTKRLFSKDCTGWASFFAVMRF